MIERISASGIPTQQRTTVNEGVRIKEIKEDQKPASTNDFKKKESQDSDQKKREKVKAVIKGLNEFLQPSHTSIKFKLHEKLNEYYVTVVDDITNEVVKEIPSKKLLDIYAEMADHLGLLFDKKI